MRAVTPAWAHSSAERARRFQMRERGLTLVECLIALVVLSIGLIGMARLMLEGLRNGHGALLRTQAVNLVTDMAERIRANPSARGAYECASYAGVPSTHRCAPTDAAAGTNCSAVELAEDDLARWLAAASVTLPLASGMCAANVEYTAPSKPNEPERFHISVSWIERGEPSPATYRSELLVVSP
jgi:type IV pilus modification protein PilV